MAAATRMTMRMRVERNTQTGTDRHGQRLAPTWTVLHAALPCWVWFRTATERNTDELLSVYNDLRAIVPASADLTEADEVAGVVDRVGDTVLPGRYRIRGVIRRHDHQELVLEAYR